MEGSINLVQALKNHFAMLQNRCICTLPELSDEYRAWLVRWDNKIGVAIPYNKEEKVHARFADVEVESCIIDGMSVLFMFIQEENNDKQWRSLTFANICENFIAPGENGSNRLLVTDDLQAWCAKWKELLGNASREVPVHSVMGELLVYRWLKQQGIEVEWTGNNRNRLDFMGIDGAWEVKSTLSHSDLQITVNGHKQLTNQKNCPLYLMFCRLEYNPQGESVNDIVSSLVVLGVDEEMLEKALKGLGLEKGEFGRKQKFSLIEMRRYPVNDKFPKLSEDNFKDRKLPDGIIKINYVIDLANLEYEVIE